MDDFVIHVGTTGQTTTLSDIIRGGEPTSGPASCDLEVGSIAAWRAVGGMRAWRIADFSKAGHSSDLFAYVEHPVLAGEDVAGKIRVISHRPFQVPATDWFEVGDSVFGAFHRPGGVTSQPERDTYVAAKRLGCCTIPGVLKLSDIGWDA